MFKTTGKGSRVRGRFSPATVIACVALFFSMSGAGMAATGYRITSLWQISPKVRHALRGERGMRGAVGPQGATGPQGPAGVSVLAHAVWVFSDLPSLPADHSVVKLAAECPVGTSAISGSYGAQGGTVVTSDGPSFYFNDASTWGVEAHLSRDASQGSLEVRALCAPTS